MVTNSIRAIRKQGYWRQLWFAINSFSRIFFLLRKLVSLTGQINFFFQSVIIRYIFYRTMLQDITTGNIANRSLAYEMISQSLTWLSIALAGGTFVRLINLLDSEESGANNKTSLTEISILTMSNSVHLQIMGLVCDTKEDHRSYRRNFCSCEKKAWKKIQVWTGFEPLTSAIPVQHSTNWTNKPTGSRSVIGSL